MFRHTKFAAPYGRGENGTKVTSRSYIYKDANRDTVSPEKLNQLIKTFQGEYPRINIDKGYGRDQPYGDRRFETRAVPKRVVSARAAGGLIDRPYGPSTAGWIKGMHYFADGGKAPGPIGSDIYKKLGFKDYEDYLQQTASSPFEAMNESDMPLGLRDQTQGHKWGLVGTSGGPGGIRKTFRDNLNADNLEQFRSAGAFQNDQEVGRDAYKKYQDYTEKLKQDWAEGRAKDPNVESKDPSLAPFYKFGTGNALRKAFADPELQSVRLGDFNADAFKKYSQKTGAMANKDPNAFSNEDALIYERNYLQPQSPDLNVSPLKENISPVSNTLNLPSMRKRGTFPASPIARKGTGDDIRDFVTLQGARAGEQLYNALPQHAKGGWIQGAVNPAHKGYCTPMTKSTCTGARRRFAETMKKHHGFHAQGGRLVKDYPEYDRVMKEFTMEKGGSLAQIRKRPGGSNVGKKTFANGSKRHGPYAGPSGGAPAGSYPIPDRGHAVAALRLAGHAPNPAGIKAAVHRKFPDIGKKKKCTGGKMMMSYKYGGVPQAGKSAWDGARRGAVIQTQ